MPLYEMTPDAFRPISQSSFADRKVRERDDLQRLLRTQINVLGDGQEWGHSTLIRRKAIHTAEKRAVLIR